MTEPYNDSYNQLDDQMKNQFKDGFKYGLEFLLKTRLIQRCEANLCPGRPYLSDKIQDFIKTLITGESPPPQITFRWIPPQYDYVDEFCTRACNERKFEFEIGVLNGQPLRAKFAQYVIRWGDGENDLRGNCVLKLPDGTGVWKEIPVKLLGNVSGTGTAILMDPSGGVWLHNTIDAVDPYVTGLSWDAALVLRNGQIMEKGKRIEILEAYQDAKVEIIPADDDSDEEYDLGNEMEDR
jgi:hypothetical protein